MEQRPRRPVRETGIICPREFPREEHRATVEILLEACSDLLRLRRQDLTRPAEPTRLVFAVERRQARGDPAWIRLNIEPIPDPPQTDRQTIRDEGEGHRHRESVMRSGPWPHRAASVAGSNPVEGASGTRHPRPLLC